ncbi:MAG: DUF4157 domain-containing protein, partial [Cyanobacteria bacterium P01_C01_bin.72]
MRQRKKKNDLTSSLQFSPQARPFSEADNSNDTHISAATINNNLALDDKNFGDINLFPHVRPTTNQNLLFKSTTISNPNDWEEQQADNIAAIALNHHKQPIAARADERLEEELTTKSNSELTAKLQRSNKETSPEADASQGGTASPELVQDLDDVIHSGKGKHVNAQLQATMTGVTGNDYSQLHVFDNPQAHDICRRSGAAALNYKGNNILYGKNQNQPHSDQGKLLAYHEMVHADQKGATNHKAGQEKSPAIAAYATQPSTSTKKDNVIHRNVLDNWSQESNLWFHGRSNELQKIDKFVVRFKQDLADQNWSKVLASYDEYSDILCVSSYGKDRNIHRM